MKILYFNYLYDIKYSSVGAAAHVREIVHALRSLSVEVHVYNLNKYQSIESSYQSPLRSLFKDKLSFYLRQPNAIRANLRYFIKEWKLISMHKPDIVLMRYNLLNISLPIICKILKIPLVLEINAPCSYESKFLTKDAFHWPIFPELFERLSLFLASRVIVVSKALKKFYVNWGVLEDKISVIPNGADIRQFINSKYPEKLKELKNFTVVGFIGSFHYWHGIENLVHLVENIGKSMQEVKFLFIGRGPLEFEIKKRLQEKGIIDKAIFEGFVPHEEIPNYLKVMDIVVAPYPKMDFFYYSPLKIFEYMAAGKAVVATNLGQIGEIIVDGTNGFLVPPADIQAMIEKLSMLIKDGKLRNQIGINARKTIESKYTWKIAAEKVKQVCHTALEAQR